MLVISFTLFYQFLRPEHIQSSLQLPNRPVEFRVSRIAQAEESIIEIL